MTLDDSALKSLRSRETRASATRSGCLSAETLARAASGGLGLGERAGVADHLAACADCAEELRLIEPFGAWAERSAAALGRSSGTARLGPGRVWVRPFWQFVSAAALLIVCGALAMWNVALHRENRELQARAAIPARATDVALAPQDAVRDTVAYSRPHVNVPIVDLQPDALRGAADSGKATASVSEEAELVTLILNSDSRESSGVYTLNVLDAQGRSIWKSEALEKTPYQTFTIALSPRALGAGVYRLELSHSAGDRRKPLETYSLRIEPPRAKDQGR